MKEVYIEIENKQLAELGVDQPAKYKAFRFNESHFLGYWISHDIERCEDIIVFYVGAQTFNCKCSQRNITLFESILDPKYLAPL
jgi:hypothetical protein